ncbi:MAG: hypothetical protein E7430_07915 [Ruminococcaceae bacterium]|nr:hypothetical protein [Oscillospiraceae bacterium]
MRKNEVKWGAILSYILIIASAAYGLIVTPYMIPVIGDVEYGVYKSITALSSSLLVLDFGVGSTVMRYVASYNSENKQEEINRFLSLAFTEMLMIMLLLAVVCGGIYFTLPAVYGDGFTTEQLEKAKELFLLMTFSLLLHVVENVISGIIGGYNKFSISKTIKLMQLVFRGILIYSLLTALKDSLILVLIDIVLSALTIFIEWIYVSKKHGVVVSLSISSFHSPVFIESTKYTALIFLTSIAAQINGNLDNVVVGALVGPEAVAVYSMGLLIFGMFENLSTAISGVMLPMVTNILKEPDGITRVQGTIVKAGRIQFVLLGAAVVGFLIIGKQFIGLWLGNGYEDVYIISIILMVPALFELCVNVSLSVLRAKNMLSFRTIILIATTALNAIVTVVGVSKYGYLAAAIGTALSFIIGSLIIMNIYYNRKLSFKMLRIYKEIFSGIWICLLVAGGALFVSSRFLFNEGWGAFAGNVSVFCVVYFVMLTFFGLKDYEKGAALGRKRIS